MSRVDQSTLRTTSNRHCPICSLLLPGIQQCISHLRQVHRNDTEFSLRSFISDDCSQTFKTFGGFNSHVYQKHRNCFGLAPVHLTESVSVVTTVNSLEPTIETFEPHGLTFDSPNSFQYTVHTLLGTDEAFQREQAARFLLKLREICNVSNKMVLVIMDAFKNLLDSSVATTTASIEDSLTNSGIDISTDVQDVMKTAPIHLKAVRPSTCRMCSSRRIFLYR